MSSPGYSSARLRPRRAGLRFTRCAHLTNRTIQLRSSSSQTQHFFYSPRGPYSGFNQQHFTEMVAEREGIYLSRSSVRRIVEKSGIVSPRRRRPAKHRSRRERYPQEGMLVQIDGSPHRWFGSKGPEGTLLAAIDDATGKVLGGVFRQQEDAQGYFLLIRMIVEKY